MCDEMVVVMMIKAVEVVYTGRGAGGYVVMPWSEAGWEEVVVLKCFWRDVCLTETTRRVVTRYGGGGDAG